MDEQRDLFANARELAGADFTVLVMREVARSLDQADAALSKCGTAAACEEALLVLHRIQPMLERAEQRLRELRRRTLYAPEDQDAREAIAMLSCAWTDAVYAAGALQSRL